MATTTSTNNGGAAASGGQSRRTTEQDEAIVSRIEDSLYQDYSRVTPEDVGADIAAARSQHNGTAGGGGPASFLPAAHSVGSGSAGSIASGLSSGSGGSSSGGGGSGLSPLVFPAKLHEMLSDPDAAGLVAWLPHGRSWKVLDAAAFARSELLSRHFHHGNFRSFMRLVSGWGFRRVERGRDEGSYYHQLFLRGMNHLCARMSRAAIKTRRGERRSIFTQLRGVTPDFYRISEQFPLPTAAAAPVARLVSSPSLQGAAAEVAAVPDGTVSSSSSGVAISAAARPLPQVVSSSHSSIPEAVTSSSQSVASALSSHSTTFTTVRRGGNAAAAASYANANANAYWDMNAAAAAPIRRPDPVASMFGGRAPDSPTSVMSSSQALLGPTVPAAPPLLLTRRTNNFEAANSGVGQHALPRDVSLGSLAHSGSTPAELATAALQQYIANNAASVPMPLGGANRVSAGSLASAGGGSSGGVALAGGSEVFLRRLRERAELIENLRSIMQPR